MENIKEGVCIVGGGIAGLTAALSLAYFGIRSTVFEKHKNVLQVGAGLQLSPNATKVLKRLGVLRELQKYAVSPEHIQMINSNNFSVSTSLPISEYVIENDLTPYLTAHRQDLYNCLYNACLDTDLIELVESACIIKYDDNSGELTVSTNSLEKTLRPKTIIAADGIWSKIRQDCFERDNEAIFTSFVSWRATIDSDELLWKKNLDVRAFLGKNIHMIVYPIRNNKEYNFVAITKGDSYNITPDRSRLLKNFQNTNKLIFDQLSKIENWKIWPLYAMPSSKFMSPSNKVLFIGDASHGFLPFAAQGAGMAIEDAFSVAQAIKLERFETYQEERKNRIAKVTRRGNINGYIYHLNDAMALARDQILKVQSPMRLLKSFDWLYKY